MNSQNLTLESTPYQPPMAQDFAFADWKVLPALNRLEDQRSAKQISIEPRLMHLLCFLAANKGRVVDRDTLVEQLWPRVVVNENSLTRAVSELRKHLRNETATERTVIETIPKKGYRLLAHEPKSSREPHVFATNIVSKVGLTAFSWHTPKILTGAAIAASLAIAVTLLPLTDSTQTESPAIAALVDEVIAEQPSYFGGEVTLSASQLPVNEPTTTRPVISYDGSSFAYLKYDNTGTTVFYGPLSERVEAAPIYHNEGVLLNLAWSPTGNSLLFARKPTMTTTALFSGKGQNLELLALDLSTREVQRLVNDKLDSNSEIVSDQNLT